MNTEIDPRTLTMAHASAMVDEWIRIIGRGYFDPLTNMAVLTEEVGEVARIMARTYGMQRPKPGDKGADRLAEELADVVWVVMAIANQTGVDLPAAWLDKLRAKTIRDRERF